MGISGILCEFYGIKCGGVEKLRDGGSASYGVISGGEKFFLREIKPAFFETAKSGAEIQAYLRGKGFPVPPIIFTKDGRPCAESGGGLYILYEFIEGIESDPDTDAEAIGGLTGDLHRAMKDYPGALKRRGKYFFVDRYVGILYKKNYPKAESFAEYGEELWGRVRDLPRGYCHGDMYRGNIHKTPGGKFYVLDFDTSCEGFPLYDAALICDRTDYFNFDERGYGKSKAVFQRFLPEYLKRSNFSKVEIGAFFDMIALYHFALQATIIEIHGLDCVDNAFLDRQLGWLIKWRELCEKEGNGEI